MFRERQFQFETSDEVGDISTLRTIVGMQLIEDEIAQHRFCGVGIAMPQFGILLLHETVIQHLEVGEKDVRCGIDDGVSIFDDVMFAHRGCVCLAFRTFSDEESRRYHSAESFIVVYCFCETCCLVGSEGVHGVHDDDLDTLLCTTLVEPIAVVEDRIEETLGLTGTGTGGEERRLRLMPVTGSESLEATQLVLMGKESGWLDIQGDSCGFFGSGFDKGRLQGDIWSFEESVFRVANELIESAVHFLFFESESGFNVSQHRFLHLVRLLEW